ncbi:hypothetical protein [Thiolapillus sp.]|uniref:hypothetical protein n=1 Tax=Thiolapillus sp. TaxID=2017437 RepID=UPI003AF50254
MCLRPRDRFWDIPVPKIDSAFDNLLVPQPSWSPSTTQQLRKLVAAPYLPPNDWTPRLDAYFASPLALCARRVSSAASRLLGSTSLRFALHGWQRGLAVMPAAPKGCVYICRPRPVSPSGGFFFLTLSLVKGLRPEGKAYGLIGPFDERLSQELGATVL